jgi:uncharacterized protein
MSRVVHFEIPAENPERVAGFYKKVLGWEIQKWEGPVDYWLISTGKETEPGIHGGIARKKDRPASGILVTAQVDSVDESLKKIVGRSRGQHRCPETGDSWCRLPGIFP